MHLSLERLMTTVMLLLLAISVMPHILPASQISSQSDVDSSSALLSTILTFWAIDLVAISLSVDETSLSLSVVPFVLFFPVALTVSAGDYQAFAGIVGLAFLTIIFVVARYVANSM